MILNRPLTTETERTRRERGSALIVVLMFTLGVLAMMSFLLPITRQAVVAEGEMQRTRGLHFVLQTGINDAMNELVVGDQDGDGAGARGTGLPSSNPVNDPTSPFFAPGIQVNVGGTGLGFYKTWIDDTNFGVDGTLDLVVVAVWPDFVRPRQTLSSRVRFRSEFLSINDRNALSISGASDIGGGKFRYGANWHSSELKIEDENDNNAAINISDPHLYSFFADGLDSGDADVGAGNFGNEDSNLDTADNDTSTTEDSRTDLKGWDKNASPGTQGTAGDTVTNTPSKNYVNDAALDVLATSWRDYATYATTTTDIDGDANGGDTFTSSYAGPIDITDINSSTGTPTDVVRLAPGKSDVILDNVTIKGKGTLIIPRNLTLTNGAKIEWEGNIVVAPDGTGSESRLRLDDGELKLKGNLVLAPDPSGTPAKDAVVEVNAAKLDVEGTVMGLSTAASGDAKFHILKQPFKSEPDVKIKGMMAFLGEKTNFHIKGQTSFSQRSKLHVDGGVAFATPSGRTIKNIDMDHRSHLHLKYKETEFLDAIAKAVPPGNPPPPFFNRMGYVERPGGALTGTGSASGHWTGELKAMFDAIGAKLDGTSKIGTP